MIEIIYFMFLFLISFGIGKKVLNLFKFRLSFLEELVFSVGLGYLMLSLTTFFLGIFQLYYSIVFYLVLSLLFLFLIPTMLKFLVLLPKKIMNNHKGLNRLGKILSILLLFLFFLNLFGTVSPPHGIDVTVYHLSIPKLYIMKQGITYLPTINQEAYPQGFEMLFLIGLILKNGILAKLFAYSFGVLLALALFSFGKRFFNPQIGILSAIIFYTLPIVVEYNVQAYVDIGSAWLVFMCVYAFIYWYKNNYETRWLVLSAIFAGFAVSAKIIGASIIIAICLVLVSLIFFKKIPFDKGIKSLLIFGGIACLIYSPWFLKNLIYRGNPFFPYFYKYFGGTDWSNVVESHRQHTGTVVYGGHNILYILLVPFVLIFNSGAQGSFLGWGPIFLAFIPLYFLKKNKDKTMNLLFYISALMFLIWYVASPIKSIRVLYIYPLLAIIAGFVIFWLLQYKPLRKVIIILIFSTFLFGMILAIGIRIKTGQL